MKWKGSTIHVLHGTIDTSKAVSAVYSLCPAFIIHISFLFLLNVLDLLLLQNNIIERFDALQPF